MEQLTRITGSLCISVLAMGLLYNMGHFPQTEKTVRFVIVVYIILSCINSFEKDEFDFGFTQIKDEQYSEDYTAELRVVVVEETKYEMEKILKKRLEEKNISYNHISVHILEQNGFLTTEKIVISCDNSEISKAEECIRDFITEDTVLIIGE